MWDTWYLGRAWNMYEREWKPWCFVAHRWVECVWTHGEHGLWLKIYQLLSSHSLYKLSFGKQRTSQSRTNFFQTICWLRCHSMRFLCSWASTVVELPQSSLPASPVNDNLRPLQDDNNISTAHQLAAGWSPLLEGSEMCRVFIWLMASQWCEFAKSWRHHMSFLFSHPYTCIAMSLRLLSRVIFSFNLQSSPASQAHIIS